MRLPGSESGRGALHQRCKYNMPNTNRRATNVKQHSPNKSPNRLDETSRLRGRCRPALYLPGLLLALSACGGGGGGGGGSGSGNQPMNDGTSDTPVTST